MQSHKTLARILIVIINMLNNLKFYHHGIKINNNR